MNKEEETINIEDIDVPAKIHQNELRLRQAFAADLPTNFLIQFD